MARLPRLHRVVGRWADGRTRTRNYLTPEAAEERRAKWAGELTDSEEGQPEPATEVVVTPSYPVTWPTVAADRFDIPDSTMTRAVADDLLARLGIRPDAVRSLTVTPNHIVVEYDPDPSKPGKREPQTWTVYVEDE